MFNFEGLKRWWWYQQRVKYLQGYSSQATINLEYFKSVRNNNMMRQKIGLQDFNISKLPRVNPKKEKLTMGNSETVLNLMLTEIQKELEKLRRWQRRNKVRNKTITGKVIFS